VEDTFGSLGGRRVAAVPVAALVVAYAVVAMRFAPFSSGVAVATAIPVLLVALAAAGRRRGRAHEIPEPPPSTVGVVGWSVLVAAIVGVELATFLSSPRVDHPTISSIAEMAFRVDGVRAAAFALWLGAGWYLATR
jgi:hypothetical protein